MLRKQYKGYAGHRYRTPNKIMNMAQHRDGQHKDRDVVHVAAVGDVHCGAGCHGVLQPLFARIAEVADVLVLCGDLTNHGTADEAQALVKELAPVSRIPVLAVLGNHDFESGHTDDLRHILTGAGVTFFDGDAQVIHGVGFVGVKGFGGGFGRGTLGAFGEPATKQFVQEAVHEAMKLESALARVNTPHRLAILHYSPIRATVEGEPPEIFPYLGTSRLEEPLNRYQVTAAVHGHAHKGAPEGRTSAGVPVYNVSMHVMRHNYPDRPPFRLLNIPVKPPTPVEEVMPTATPVETNIG